MNDKISIICPVFNNDKDVYKCLISVKNQTYQNFECIIVDDGSTDDSGKICEDFCNSNDNFIYFKQSNAGVSNARNNGMKKATGKYIGFVDSDDVMLPNHLDNLVNGFLFNDKIDLASSGIIFSDKLGKDLFKSSEKKRIFSFDESLLETFNLSTLQGLVWNKLFKADIIRSNQIRFDENITIYEDHLFVFEYLANCKEDSLYSGKLTYKYFYNESGALHTSKNSLNELVYPYILIKNMAINNRFSKLIINTVNANISEIIVKYYFTNKKIDNKSYLFLKKHFNDFVFGKFIRLKIKIFGLYVLIFGKRRIL